MVAGKGFEPLKHCAADLQSVPFGHSGNPPYAESAQLDYQIRRYFRKRRPCERRGDNILRDIGGV